MDNFRPLPLPSTGESGIVSSDWFPAGQKTVKRQHAPRVLLVGVGRFGQEHLKTWQRLEARGEVELVGAVVAQKKSQRMIAQQHSIAVSIGLNPRELKRVDAVDIVTPSPTHFLLARKCLRHTNVLLEKPLATTIPHARALNRYAKRYNRILMVDHVFRFNPVVQALKHMVSALTVYPCLINGSFLNPSQRVAERHCPSLEFLHYFDVIDYLFGGRPDAIVAERRGTVNEISLRYTSGINAVLEIGWKGQQKIRTFNLIYSDQTLRCDFLDDTLTVLKRDRVEKLFLHQDPGPLEIALGRFAQALRTKSVSYPDGNVGMRVVEVALRARPKTIKRNPKVAIIGGGIFGVTCGLEIGRYCEVKLFERHSDLLTEASYANQWRHHSGFHYPRSLETISEIQSARDAFESLYGDALTRNVVSYYCTSSSGREITKERYLAVCSENKLRFSIEGPPAGLIDQSAVSLCIKTDEAVLDYPQLKEMIRKKLSANPRVEIALNTEVLKAKLRPDGSKVLTVRKRNDRRVQMERFDYLINATYANSNLIARWLGFPVRRLRFDLCEILVLEIPIPEVAVTILDGPFMSLVSTGQKHTFTLSHIHESILKSEVTADGGPPQWGAIQSNRINMLRHCERYLPILRKAKFLESRFGTRTVTAYNEDFDARPTVVTSHGFGCWSVLGGKIVTCVSNAREIAKNMLFRSCR